MVIAGVDPGSRVTGYGVIKIEKSDFSCLEYGAIEGISQGQCSSFAHRLMRIHVTLYDLLYRHSPSIVAVEDVFHALNVKSALKLGHARGVVFLTAAQLDIPLVEYSPLEIKKAVVGYGRADKKQIQRMVRTLLNLRKDPQPHDAADALATALCHAFNKARVLKQ